jgi:hypothetical protein
VRRRGGIGRRRFLDALGLRQFLGERQRFAQQIFNSLTRLLGIIRHPLRYAEILKEKQVFILLIVLWNAFLMCHGATRHLYPFRVLCARAEDHLS